MQYTTNFNLKKLELTDAPPDITELNANWDTLDQELSELDNKADKDLGNVTAADFHDTLDRTASVEYIFDQNRATEAEAVAGTDRGKYMTPHLTKAAIDSSTPYRVGDIRFLGYPLADADYLPCNGQLLDGTAYPELYATVGTNYGGAEPLEDLTALAGPSFPVRDLARGGGKLVAVGDSGKIAVSSDEGATWTEQVHSSAWNLIQVSYGGGKFIITARYQGGILVGDGGGSWRKVMLSSTVLSGHKPAGSFKVCYGNGRWLMLYMVDVGDGESYSSYESRAATSTDGLTWTGLELPASLLEYGPWNFTVAYGNGLFMVTVRTGNTGARGDTATWNGSSWTALSGSVPFAGFLFADGRWLGWASGVYELSGATWHWRSGVVGLDGGKSDTLYVLGGSYGLYTSFDGLSWRQRAATSGALRVWAVGEGRWLLLKSDGTLATTQENLCQFYLPGYNATMKYCYIKASEGGRTYYQGGEA